MGPEMAQILRPGRILRITLFAAEPERRGRWESQFACAVCEAGTKRIRAPRKVITCWTAEGGQFLRTMCRGPVFPIQWTPVDSHQIPSDSKDQKVDSRGPWKS